MRRPRWFTGLVCAAAAAYCAMPARAASSIGWFAIDGSGQAGMSGGTWTLSGTIGQPMVGLAAGSRDTAYAGFWAAAGPFALVGVGDGSHAAPFVFRLAAAAPNPLLDRTSVSFELAAARQVRLGVYDAAGRLRRTLAQGPFPAGRFARVWDALDDSGRRVGPGVYFVRLDAQTVRLQEKLVVLR